MKKDEAFQCHHLFLFWRKIFEILVGKLRNIESENVDWSRKCHHSLSPKKISCLDIATHKD
jgi:hypothetical protein